jgi:hypothetical protein
MHCFEVNSLGMTQSTVLVHCSKVGKHQWPADYMIVDNAFYLASSGLGYLYGR